ncbi:preprotein translocase subunit SecA [Chlorobium phaeovibrioides]|uniref:Protein translocase subunit SecA n=2 Tax=Chlorobium phaeovibrioides TaxID=1094 RepID=SECA_CHLPM|nr:preprotein translocase subunit SecA [Chlorobium phaeovibrioides]A4SEF9.1 RecName: Full=Protein translocase subunit SecA [Chlorobium phaeovibrioides DSM 265]HCD35495.1 preprotein translocase subunit SecA [Chlorobium sp.]KAA6232486.1 preprotein translocase subunit SecA [Chlorobium phaeovibrioides]MWV54294.1 preprotein translocase subunit SecA [Chlorobium phaeovibrioides]RTY35003.1 preprotein translocase subunit SecA [Chlorobium phaeovibrioides]
MLKIFEKIFGSKHEKDIQKIQPVINRINEIQEGLKGLGDDELKEKGKALKSRIRGVLMPIEDKKKELYRQLDNPELSLEEAESIHSSLDALAEEYEEKTASALEEALPETFALVKETCRRLKGLTYQVMGRDVVWDMVPYDVQLIGGIVLHSGKISEMATGEGKTLVSTLPTFLNALTGRGVHLVTVNDYLAQRDKEWMNPVFDFHNISVGVILNTMRPEERRQQYQCDVTYGTNNEFGFDYLRDNMAGTVEEMVQRDFYFAIVDEVDSVLIDEARTPLIISGPVPNSDNSQFQEIKPWIEQIVRAQQQLAASYLTEAEKALKESPQSPEAGLALLRVKRGQPKNTRFIKILSQQGMAKLIQVTENEYLRDNSSRMHEVDDELYFAVDEKAGTIDLTDKGREFLSKLSHQDRDLFLLPDVGTEVAAIDDDESVIAADKITRKDAVYRLFAERSERLHNISQLLKAYSLFLKDDEYVVQNGQVMIVDEFTGRILPGRRYSDGLHQAIEAKENVKIEGETQTMATVTIQNFFRLYEKLAGMTGTAETEASEFFEIYKLDVVAIPTNRPIVRKDMDDLVYKTRREKYNAIALKVEELQKKGQPVLVGTTSVEVSETLSRMLRARRIAHNVLNAKQNEREAEIVEGAGRPGAVTIATNMAGRGTDIKLGEGVREKGGLYILGSERHESRRIDRQLRGRAGRQGDPGESVFFVSLEDELMRLFGSDRVISVMDRLGHEEGDVIEHSMITKSIERAQKKVEEQNFAIRKRLLEYDDVLNQQREVIYTRRRDGLIKERLTTDILDLLRDYCDSVIDRHSKNLDTEGIEEQLLRELSIEFKPDRNNLEENATGVSEELYNSALAFYRRKEEAVPADIMRQIEKYAVLSVIDKQWRDHLREIDTLREGINLRAYGQKDPLLEYKQEAYNLFIQMLSEIELETLSLAFKLFPVNPDEVRAIEERQRQAAVRQEKLVTQHDDAASVYNASPGAENEAPLQRPVTADSKPGRNDPCPCGSGKKYKNCHGQQP